LPHGWLFHPPVPGHRLPAGATGPLRIFSGNEGNQFL